MAEIIGQFEKTVMSVNSLATDPDIDSMRDAEPIKVLKRNPHFKL